MVLLVLAIILGLIIGVWIDKFGLKKNLDKSIKVKILLYSILIIGVTFF